ncbi:MAG: efflux RND transporter periplasmic adaptor subunit [Mangrovibacterium sp.]
MNTRPYLSFLGIALIALSACSSQTSNSEADVAIPVSIEEIQLGNIEQTINSTGTLLAVHEAVLLLESSGEYMLHKNPQTSKPYALGDKVSKGQVIIELRSEEYINGIAIESKKLSLDIAKQTFEKQKSLFEKGGVTQSELSQAEVSFVNAQDSYELAQIQLGKTKVIAPFSGVITSLPTFTQGVVISSGTEVLTIMDYKEMLLEVNLPEKYINEIKPGQSIRVMNYTVPEDTISGEVSQISPAISTETRTFTCKLDVDNQDLLLRPGMFAQADIILDRHENVVVVKKDVVISNRRGKSVFVVSNSTAEERKVTFGYENANYVEITSGLKANDRLVTKGFETLRHQSKVKILK